VSQLILPPIEISSKKWWPIMARVMALLKWVLLETQSYTRQASGRILYPYLMMDALCDDAARLKGYGVGPLAPVASNDTEKGKDKKRRVELVKQ